MFDLRLTERRKRKKEKERGAASRDAARVFFEFSAFRSYLIYLFFGYDIFKNFGDVTYLKTLT